MVKLILTLVALSALAQAVAAFDPKTCTGFAFSAKDRKTLSTGDGYYTAYYCGTPPPDSKYCKEQSGYAWVADVKWCNFMISAVVNGGNALAPGLALNKFPTPNGGPIEMWTCYITSGSDTSAYIVDYRGKSTLPNPANIGTQCDRTGDMFAQTWLPQPFNSPGCVKTFTPTPVKQWEQCYFNSLFYPGYEYKECPSGQYCEFKSQWWSTCLPDPRLDHNCCLSPNGNTCATGQCCKGYFCNTDDAGQKRCEEGTKDDAVYKGICSSGAVITQKTERSLWSRCLIYSSSTDPKKGDCASGYNCVGDDYYASCQPDPKAVNDCNLAPWETACRPGDCAAGWFCKQFFNNDGSVSWTQCRPGVETLTRDGKPVNDGLCSIPNLASSYGETLGQCSGAVCSIHGDPHIVSCDDKKWDCQAEGLFVLMRNFMYEIQAHFTQMDTILGTSASITDAVAIDYKNDTRAPKIQFMFPDFVTKGETYNAKSKVIAACPVLFYVNDALVDISKISGDGAILHQSNGVKVTLKGWDKILVEYTEPTKNVVSTVQISIEGGGPFTDWGCIFTTTICLPKAFESQFKSDGKGLLGSPDGNPKNDWVKRDGSLAVYGWGKDAFDFCVTWCVHQDESIMGGKDFTKFMCQDQTHVECGVVELLTMGFTAADIQTKCCGTDLTCVPSEACKLDLCATGDTIIEEHGDDDDDAPVINDDCSDLGAFLSQPTGTAKLGRDDYKGVKSCRNTMGEPWMTGWDESLSVLVGKSYKCIKGTGVEGSIVVNNNFVVANSGPNGCTDFVFTSQGACVGPSTGGKCIQVGGDVKIGSAMNQKISIMAGSDSLKCDLAYAGLCSVGDNSTCPGTKFGMADEYLFTGGQVTHEPTLDLSDFQKQLTILSQKQKFWKDYAPDSNGVKDLGSWSLSNGIMTLNKSPLNSCVQVFNFPNGWPAGVISVKFVGLEGKTILINVGGTNTMQVPFMEDGSGCGNVGEQGFDVKLLMSTVWNFYGGSLTLTGSNHFQGSIVVNGDLIMQAAYQLGRTLVLGNLIQDKEGSNFLNYPFQPQCPLPLPSSDVCTVEAPPPCVEDMYKVLTADEVCPNAPDSFKAVELRSSKGTLPEGEPVIYGIEMHESPNDGGAPYVSFKVDNPFPGMADMYIKYEKPVGKYALDPDCKRVSQVKDCQPDAIEIVAGCVAHDGLDPYTMVSVYFASDSNEVFEQGLAAEVDKCCDPEDYANKYVFGVVMFTFEIKCACPDTYKGVQSA